MRIGKVENLIRRKRRNRNSVGKSVLRKQYLRFRSNWMNLDWQFSFCLKTKWNRFIPKQNGNFQKGKFSPKNCKKKQQKKTYEIRLVLKQKWKLSAAILFYSMWYEFEMLSVHAITSWESTVLLLLKIKGIWLYCKFYIRFGTKQKSGWFHNKNKFS